MSLQVAEAQVHAAVSSESLTSSPKSVDDNLPVSVDLIVERLYLGNLTAACDPRTLCRLGVTHVLTVDSVPLPRVMLDSTDTDNLTLKYVKMADVAKEDLITHLPETNEFIQQALDSGGTVLVHCYFGVSRSAAVVIAHIMTKTRLCYEDAFKLVKAKRRFIGPNVGFVAQLKLFRHMGCKIDRDDPRYKQFQLKMAGQKLKEVKILPQVYSALVKQDPGLAQERPQPTVYRCKKCRRVVAAQTNIIPHVPYQMKVELARKGQAGPSAEEYASVRSGDVLLDRLRSLTTDEGVESREYEGVMVEEGIAAAGDAVCRLVHFVEPMSWMKDVTHSTQGKLHCPKCDSKIGSFSWVMGCKCPCGKKVAPAFYLVPSKVELSTVVQNVQLTV